jgi:hypothetical protein
MDDQRTIWPFIGADALGECSSAWINANYEATMPGNIEAFRFALFGGAA